MHPRTLIRKKIVTLLLGNTAAGNKVSTNRVVPLDDKTELPYISVTLKQETIEEYNSSPKSMLRRPQFEIEVTVKGQDEDAASDRLDALCDQIETILGLNDLDENITEWDSLTLVGDVIFDFEQEGELIFGAAVMTYEAKYVRDTIASSAEQDTDDLNTINAKWKIGHNNTEPDSVIDAQTDLDFEEVP